MRTSASRSWFEAIVDLRFDIRKKRFAGRKTSAGVLIGKTVAQSIKALEKEMRAIFANGTLQLVSGAAPYLALVWLRRPVLASPRPPCRWARSLHCDDYPRKEADRGARDPPQQCVGLDRSQQVDQWGARSEINGKLIPAAVIARTSRLVSPGNSADRSRLRSSNLYRTRPRP